MIVAILVDLKRLSSDSFNFVANGPGDMLPPSIFTPRFLDNYGIIFKLLWHSFRLLGASTYLVASSIQWCNTEGGGPWPNSTWKLTKQLTLGSLKILGLFRGPWTAASLAIRVLRPCMDLGCCGTILGCVALFFKSTPTLSTYLECYL